MVGWGGCIMINLFWKMVNVSFGLLLLMSFIGLVEIGLLDGLMLFFMCLM